MASDHLADTVQLWREGHLTNWEYLTTLNKMAGRCYNDLMQYPVMPFVLADYTSTTLDLTDPQSYRLVRFVFCFIVLEISYPWKRDKVLTITIYLDFLQQLLFFLYFIKFLSSVLV